MVAVYDSAYSAHKAGPNDLVLIGGASTASTLLIRLADQVRSQGLPSGGLTIRCFDKKGVANGGIAYGGCSDHHVLNSVRSEMSPWKPDAFHEYCVENGLGSCRNDFNRRKDYADFLERSVKEALNTLRVKGAGFVHYPHNVYVRKNGHGLDICDLQDDSVLLSDCAPQQIALAVGYGPNDKFRKLRDSDAYIHSLYDSGADKIRHIRDGANIVFAGSGPALYDFVNDMKGAGVSHVKLTVFSGASDHPLSVRDVSIEAGEESRTPSFITTGFHPCAEDLCRKVMEEFDRAASRRRVALDILKNLAPALKAMDTEQAELFRCSPMMDFIRHTATPVPDRSHRTLMDYNPSFIKAYLNEEDVKLKSGGFVIKADQGRLVEADYIVNGTGHGRHNAPILERLKKDNLAYVDQALGVLQVDESGYRLAGSGIACPGPAIHSGCDGVESFDPYAKSFVSDFLTSAPQRDARSRRQDVNCAI